MTKDTDKKDDETRYYRIDICMKVEYKGENMPNEDHVINPIRSFVDKALKTYKKDYMLIRYCPDVYEIEKEIDPDEVDE